MDVEALQQFEEGLAHCSCRVAHDDRVEEVLLDGPQHAGEGWSEQLLDAGWPAFVKLSSLHVIDPVNGAVPDVHAVGHLLVQAQVEAHQVLDLLGAQAEPAQAAQHLLLRPEGVEDGEDVGDLHVEELAVDEESRVAGLDVEGAEEDLAVLLHLLLQLLRDGGAGETPGVTGEVGGQVHQGLQPPLVILVLHDPPRRLHGEILELPDLHGGHVVVHVQQVLLHLAQLVHLVRVESLQGGEQEALHLLLGLHRVVLALLACLQLGVVLGLVLRGLDLQLHPVAGQADSLLGSGHDEVPEDVGHGAGLLQHLLVGLGKLPSSDLSVNNESICFLSSSKIVRFTD